MTEQYDALEQRFGIDAYASPHEGFTAVLKGRYSDFIVHEVDEDGFVARLESLETIQKAPKERKERAEPEPSEADSATKKRKAEDSTDEPKKEAKTESPSADTKAGDAETPKKEGMDWEASQSELSKLVGDAPASEAMSMLRRWEESTEESGAANKVKDAKEGEHFVTLPAVAEKEKRRGIHMLIKTEAFRLMARADTNDGRVRIWHKRFERKMPSFGKFPDDKRGGGGDGKKRVDNRPKKEPWPRDRPDYLHFVLYKENIDTGTAAKDVCRMGRLDRRKGIGFAGMKDKRGVTTQRCSAYRGDKQHMLAINGNGKKTTSGGGNFSSGGRGIIRVGNFSYSSKEIRLGMLSGNRFDVVLRNVDISNPETPDEALSNVTLESVEQKLKVAAIAMQDIGFINYFGMQRFGKYHDTHEVGIAILKGDFEAAVDVIMREKADDYPNIATARTKWAKRFEGVDVKDENKAKQVEKDCARSIVRELGRFMNCEISIINSLSRQPKDYKKAFQSIAKHMRSMFLHAYQSRLWNKAASHRIEKDGSRDLKVGDLVLTEDKSRSEGGSGTSGLRGKSVKVLKEEDLKSGRYHITDVVLPLVGTRTQLPGGSTGEYILEMMKEDGITETDFSNIRDKELACGGDYRKLICMPGDVSYEIKSYSDPFQPLVQTDLMKATSTEISFGGETPSDEKAETKEPLFGMVICFTLPPSAYATIALRELMKRPTTADYQRKLDINGKSESGIEKK